MGVRFINLIIVLVFSIGLFPGCLKADGIKAICGYQESFYRGQLIWFVEGINEREFGSENGPTSITYYVTEQPLDPVMALRFDSLNSPIFIESISTFVSNQDYFPDLPGDQYTPFYLAIFSNLSGFPDSMLIEAVEVSAGGYWQEGGEWVSAQIDYLLQDRDCVWLAAFWQDEYPASPCMRYTVRPATGRSAYGYADAGERIWAYFPLGEYRFRARALINDLDGSWTVEQGTIVPDSFRIYSSGQPLVSPENEYYDTTVINSLSCRVKLPSPQNYFCVTSFVNGIESPSSGIVMIEGSSQRRADMRFDPDLMEISMCSNSDTCMDLILTNKNGREINYRVADIALGDEVDPAKIAISFLAAEGFIPDDQADTIAINVSVGDIANGSLQASLIFNFWDSIQGYLDEEYPMALVISDFTAAEEPPNPVPERLYLGQNYPNPFNSETKIPFSLSQGISDASVEIFDLLGKKVAVIPLHGMQGGHIVWDGRDKNGAELASGIYFLRLRAGMESRICKMIMLK